MLSRGRVLKAMSDAQPVSAPVSARSAKVGRRVARVQLEGEARARELLSAAEQEAERLLTEARQAAGEARLQAEVEGRANGAAQVAAQALSLAQLEARADERALDRNVQLAQLLAERLLGEALQLDPTRVAALARQALTEVRGARRMQVLAHPDDMQHLHGLESTAGGVSVFSLEADPSLERGELRIATDVGVLEARVGRQLERLAQKLKEQLR